jgi:hypothetical protein
LIRKFDTAFLGDLSGNPQRLADLPPPKYLRNAAKGETIEMAMRPTMRGPPGDKAQKVYAFYHRSASSTAMG